MPVTKRQILHDSISMKYLEWSNTGGTDSGQVCGLLVFDQSCLLGIEFRFCGMKEFWRTMSVYLALLKCTLENSEDDKFCHIYYILLLNFFLEKYEIELYAVT